MRRPTSIIAFTLSVAIVSTISCDFSSEAKKAKYRDRAIAYFQKAQYQESIIEFKNVIQIDQKDADGHYRLALAYLRVGGMPNLQGAFSELLAAVEYDPTNVDAHFQLGELYLLDGQVARARHEADLILAAAPRHSDGIALRARSAMKDKHLKEAVVGLQKALELDPRNVRAAADLATAYLQLNDPASAEVSLRHALEGNPGSYEICLAYGDFLLFIGKPEEAEVQYRRAATIAPEEDEVHLKLAAFYATSQRWPDAEAAYLKLATLRAKDERPQIVLGDFYTATAQTGKALAAYQHATEINPSSIHARNRLIEHYLTGGNLSAAEALVVKILEKQKHDPDARLFDARLRLANGKYDEAIQRLQGLVQDDPSSARVRYFLGLAYAANNQVGQAQRELTESVRLAPLESENRTALAGLLLGSGSSDLAIEQAQAALKLNPRNVQAAIVLGDAHLSKPDLRRAQETFEIILKAVPNDPLSHHRLGVVAEAQKNVSAAILHFEEALALSPRFIDALAQLTRIRLSQGRSREALERVTQHLSVIPDDPQVYNLLGRLRLIRKEDQEAERAFKKAIELDQALPSSYMNLAELYLQSGRVDQAIAEYEAALTKDQKLVPALMMLGAIHEQRKEYAQAQARYEAALRWDASFAPAANNLAWLLSEQNGNLDIALRYAQTAFERMSDDPNIADTLGWIFFKKQTYRTAASLLKQAADKLPDNPVVLYHYGRAQQKIGNKAAARAALQRSLKISPQNAGAEVARDLLKQL